MDSQGKGEYLYYYKERSQYQVGPTLGGNACFLLCTDTSGHIVSNNWQYWDGSEFHNDVAMTVVGVDKMDSCGVVTIQLSGDVARRHSDVAGEYVATGKFSTGRYIYKHKYRNYFLHTRPGYTNWGVRSEVGGGTRYIASAAAGSLCPADVRNTYSHRLGYKSWAYDNGPKLVEADPGNIRLTCTSCQ